MTAATQQMYSVVNHNRDLEYEKEQDIAQKSHEEKQYLICLRSNQMEDDDRWEIVNGRTEAYEYIKENIYMIDFSSSFILVENCKLSERKSIYAFMKHVEQFFPEDPFDIEDYIKGDWSEDEFIKYNDIDKSLYPDNYKDNQLSIEEFMNGNYNTLPLDDK